MEELTHEIVEEICGRIAKFEQLEGGISKPTYCVQPTNGSAFVLQYASPEQKEAIDHELLAISVLEEKTNIPVPKVLARGLRSEHVQGEFAKKELIVGQNLADAGHDLRVDQAVSIYAQIGSILSVLHRIGSFSSFGGTFDYVAGEVRGREGPSARFETAKDYVLNRSLKMADACKQTPFSRWAPKILEWTRTQADAFADDINPSLTHGDLSATNIMVRDNMVTGLLDFEGMRPGYAIQDIARLYNHFSSEIYDLGFDREDLRAPCMEAFWEAYSAPLHQDHKRHLDYFCQTYPLGYLTCWRSIVEAYEDDELKEITEYMNARISSLLQDSRDARSA